LRHGIAYRSLIGRGCLVGLSFALPLLGGCASVGPEYRGPQPELPPAWHGQQPVPAQAQDLATWWQGFGDPLLTQLVEQALAANLDLASAQAQLREARARRDLARAELGLSLSASASAARSRSSAAAGSGTTSDRFSAGFDASWEPDLFGGGRRSLQAAEAELAASEQDLYGVRVSLVAEVARNYLELRTAEQRLHIAEAGLATRQETYDLTRWRVQAGLVSQLDEAQAKTTLAATRASLPALRSSVSEARYRLAILLARAPGELDSRLQASADIPTAEPGVALGIPTDTLRQRPDVRAAERRLAAQTERLGAAMAARYPGFSLSGSLGLEALTLGGLFNGGAHAASLLARVAAPIFDAGRIDSTVAIQDALLEQAELAYRSALLDALQDVENALLGLDAAGQRRARLGEALAAAQAAEQLARDRYAAGLADFQSVLESQRSRLELHDQLALAQGDHGIALVQLYKALGGGWQNRTAPSALEESR